MQEVVSEVFYLQLHDLLQIKLLGLLASRCVNEITCTTSWWGFMNGVPRRNGSSHQRLPKRDWKQHSSWRFPQKRLQYVDSAVSQPRGSYFSRSYTAFCSAVSYIHLFIENWIDEIFIKILLLVFNFTFFISYSIP